VNSARRFGLADLVGLVVALVGVSFWTALPDPVNDAKLIVLAVGGAVIVPFAVARWVWGWRILRTRLFTHLLIGVAAAALAAWSVVSAIGSGAPFYDSLFGAWGRNDGLLALFAVIAIFIAAITFSRVEVHRVVTWLLAAATVQVIVGIMQVFGWEAAPQRYGSYRDDVTGTLGNTNFAAGYFSILMVLALGRLFTKNSSAFQRVWSGSIFIVLAFLLTMTQASQAYAAGAAGIAILIVVFAVSYRGRGRKLALAGAGVVVLGAIAGLISSFTGRGPVAAFWADSGFETRVEYWKASWATFTNLPVFGTGPSGLKRIMGEYRPDSYVELLGHENKLDAAHNLALQFAVTLGVVGVVLWLIVMIGSAALLLRRCISGPVASPILYASIAGAFGAYLVQGAVSVDMLPLLSIGWLLAGMSVALSRDESQLGDQPIGVREVETIDQIPLRAHPRSQKVRNQIDESHDDDSRHVGMGIATGVAILLVAISGALLFNHVNLAAQTNGRVDPEFAKTAIANSLTTCQSRNGLAQALVATQTPQDALPVIMQGVEVDPRCGFMIHFQSELAINSGELETAATSTLDGITYDPLLPAAWVLRGLYHLAVEDLPAAEADLSEAERVLALKPGQQTTENQVQVLRSQVEAARAQVAP